MQISFSQLKNNFYLIVHSISNWNDLIGLWIVFSNLSQINLQLIFNWLHFWFPKITFCSGVNHFWNHYADQIDDQMNVVNVSVEKNYCCVKALEESQMFRLIKPEVSIDSWSIPESSILIFLDNCSFLSCWSKTDLSICQEKWIAESGFSNRSWGKEAYVLFWELLFSERALELNLGDIFNIEFLKFFNFSLVFLWSLTFRFEVLYLLL